MDFVYDDGGRSRYFKAKHVGDCVTRAIAIASQHDYKEVYNYIRSISGCSPRNGVMKPIAKKAAKHFGGRWVSCMQIGSGCTTHLRADELPMGRILCYCSHHEVAVIDRVIHDTYEPDRAGTRCVYGYFVFE